MFDIHVHTSFSHDGKSSANEYTALLGQGVLEGIGFAEHVDFLPECGGYGLFDYEAYMAAILAYKKQGFKVFAGAEIDYAQRAESEIIESFKTKPFDYTICSVHMINGLSVSTNENIECFYDQHIFRDMMEKYYHELDSSLKVETFDVIGHIGIYRRYLTDEFFEKNVPGNWLNEMDNELALLCARSGKIVEVNTSGLFSPTGTTFPNEAFLRLFFEAGGRMVCPGSDAHTVLHTARGFEKAVELLNEIGFKYIYLPWDKENPRKIG